MHASKLEAALAWAHRGFRVFPLESNGKLPVVPGFGYVATSDDAVLRAWWTDPVTGVERDYNIGALTTDLVVADVDVKHGKPGMETYGGLGGHFETLTVQTPTGGYHCYFLGPDSSLAPVGEGLDIRSHNGYVLAPGSTIDGVPYQVVVDLPMSWVPLEIERKLRAPGVRAVRDEDLIDLDTPTAIANAIAWVERDAPVAIEGLSGDNTTYNVSCRLVRDFALSEEMAFSILSSHWNERCLPPWGGDELWRKVENANAYSTGELGAARPEQTFGSVVLIEPEGFDLPAQSGFGNAMDLSAVPPRPWLIPRLLMRRAVTLLPAAGASGKSTLALTLAAHLALGKSFLGYECRGACKSIVYNGEEDLQEQSRRLYAICQEYKLDYQEVKSAIMLITSEDVMLCIASPVHRVALQNEPHVAALIAAASDPDVGMLVCDPLVEIHNCDETDNGQMRTVMAALRRIAREADVSVLVPHHILKGGNAADRPGNPDVSRGAGSIVNLARVVVTLFSATDKDAETFGIPDDDKHMYVRLDDAKMNLTLASAKSGWLKKVGVKLYNGDEVGVMVPYHMTAASDGQKYDLAATLEDYMVDKGAGQISVKDATQHLQEVDPLYGRLTEQAARAKVEKLLRSGVETPLGATVKCERVLQDGAQDKILITYR